MDKSREWAIRCTHEAQLYRENCFVTLTFNNEHLPSNYSISKRDVQLFMKRLRKSIEPKQVRYYATGEYVPGTNRPHYHVLIFGHDFTQKTVWKIENGNYLYRSPELESLWPFGFSTIGSVTFESAGYCARYAMKKVGGDLALAHYTRLHPLTGKWFVVEPEFSVMSTKPGIGQGWLDKFYCEVFQTIKRRDSDGNDLPDKIMGDYVVIDGQKHPVPRFYTRKLQEEEKRLLTIERKKKVLPYKQHFTKERLAARAEVRDARISTLKRDKLT